MSIVETPIDSLDIVAASPVEALRAGGFDRCAWLNNVAHWDLLAGRFVYRALLPFTLLDYRAMAYLEASGGWSVTIEREGGFGSPVVVCQRRGERL